MCDTTQLQCVDKNTCPVGQHRVNDQCLPNNGLGSCWDGETSHDCSASTPAYADPSCELTDADASLYECSFECYATHTLVDFECVELGCPESEHLVGEDCVSNDSIYNCWNGEASINCTEIFPPPYTPECLPDESSGFFVCDYICPEGQHRVGDICYQNNDSAHCWNGEESIESDALAPTGSTGTCVDDESSGFFTCGFDCNPDRVNNGAGGCDEPVTCGESQHAVDNVCRDKDDPEYCWNGVSSVDCTASVPAGAEPTCDEDSSGEYSTFSCGFTCGEGFVPAEGQCVEAVNCFAGQHSVDNVCYENNDIQHCWDGVDSVNCLEQPFPDGSNADCMGIGGELFTCSFVCDNYYFTGGVCVLIPTDMVLVQASTFFMGCAPTDIQCDGRENPAHDVFLDTYLIDVYEVTAQQYKECVDAGVCVYEGSTSANLRTYDREGYADHPINNVNHAEATTYCAWKGKTLPTEAQWEKAARGETGLIYPGRYPVGSGRLQLCCDGRVRCENAARGKLPIGCESLWRHGYDWQCVRVGLRLVRPRILYEPE